MILFLTGMMGSGKTSVGEMLAKKLNILSIDTDDLVRLNHSKSVSDIITDEGIETFREYESTLLRQLQFNKDYVVSCGGGIILRQENIDFLQEHGTVIYLEASINTLVARLLNTNLNNRPLLNSGDLAATLTEIFGIRKSIYESTCDIQVKTDHLNEEEIADLIIEKLRSIKKI